MVEQILTNPVWIKEIVGW